MDLIASTFGLRLGYHKAHEVVWAPSTGGPFWVQSRHFIEYVLKNEPMFRGLVLINFQITQCLITTERKINNIANISNTHYADDISVELHLKINLATEKRSLFSNDSMLEERLHFLYYEYLHKYLKIKKQVNSFHFLKHKLKIKIIFIPSQYLQPQWIFFKLHQALHKGVNIRRALSRISSNVLKRGAKGLKIQIKGRINGVEKATILVEEKGKMPLQNLAADIDYFFSPLKTVYGLLGIKIWVFRGVLPKLN